MLSGPKLFSSYLNIDNFCNKGSGTNRLSCFIIFFARVVNENVKKIILWTRLRKIIKLIFFLGKSYLKVYGK